MPRSASSPTCCLEDFKIRKYVTDKYRFAGIPTIEIERTRDEVKVVLHAARPGVIIGRKGQQVDQLQDELQSLVGRRINIKIEEIARPEIQAHLVAEEIAEQLAQAGELPPHAQAGDRADDGSRRKGIKIQISGRLGGAEMARQEKQIAGSMPLSARCGRRSTTASSKRRRLKAILVFKCGLTKACTRTRPMALMPKRVKHRKSQRGRIKGNATRGNRVVFGEFGLQATQGGWVSAQTIEAGRVAATQYIRGEGRLYVRIFPHKSVTSIPLETRMGKGKGEPEYWAAVVRPGTILYELGGVTEAAAKMCLARLAHKMPIRVRMVRRTG